MNTTKMNTSGVIRVGDGRGFVLEHRVYFDFRDGRGIRKVCRKVIVTASHGLPHPPQMPVYSYQDTTYGPLLAPLGGEPSVWAECLFFDPVADVAVLGAPDSQALYEECEAYDALLETRRPFAVAAPETGEAYMPALDGVSWKPTNLEVHITVGGNGLSTGATLAGQSGSPILNAKGQAVALVSKGHENALINMERCRFSEMDMQPTLKLALPPWLLRATKTCPRKAARAGA